MRWLEWWSTYGFFFWGFCNWLSYSFRCDVSQNWNLVVSHVDKWTICRFVSQLTRFFFSVRSNTKNNNFQLIFFWANAKRYTHSISRPDELSWWPSYFSLFDSIFSLLMHLADIYVFWAADVCLAANAYIFISANGISCIALLHAFLFNLSREKPTRIPIRASGI